MRPSSLLFALAAVVAALGACGEDAPASESVTLAMVFEVRSSAVDNDETVTDSIAIASLAEDPWGAFVAAARSTLGTDPAELTVEDVRLTLDPSSVNVADLADIFHGPVALDIRIDASGNGYDIAETLLHDDTLGTEALLSPRLRYGDIVDDDRAAVLAGSFDVRFVGQSGDDFRTLGATVTLVATATFVATAIE